VSPACLLAQSLRPLACCVSRLLSHIAPLSARPLARPSAHLFARSRCLSVFKFIPPIVPTIMPANKNLERFKNLIEHLYIETNHSADDILTILATDYHFNISRSAFYTALAEWDLHKHNNNRKEDGMELRMRIASCYFLLCLKDDEIIAVLSDEGAYSAAIYNRYCK
jgi:hypothetical protein